MTATLPALRMRSGAVDQLLAAGFERTHGVGISLVRHLGALHVLVRMTSAQSSAHLLLGVGAPGQEIAWRPWSLPMLAGSRTVAAEAIAFARACESAWPDAILY